jgi:hypothetical protein
MFTKAMTITMFLDPLPIAAKMARANNKTGNDWTTSTILSRSDSKIPPRYAAKAPSKDPIPPPINTPNKARLKSTLVAYKTREKTSKP